MISWDEHLHLANCSKMETTHTEWLTDYSVLNYCQIYNGLQHTRSFACAEYVFSGASLQLLLTLNKPYALNFAM